MPPFLIFCNFSWMWGGVGFMLGYIAILLLLAILVFTHVHYDQNVGSVRNLVDDEASATATEAATAGAVHAGAPARSHQPQEQQQPDCSNSTSVQLDVGHHDDVSVTVGKAVSTALPFTPASLAFQDVSYSVKVSVYLLSVFATKHLSYYAFAMQLPTGVERVLLHRISGSAQPGRMLALMGASGAGEFGSHS